MFMTTMTIQSAAFDFGTSLQEQTVELLRQKSQRNKTFSMGVGMESIL